jgi:TonB family protein
MATSFGRYKVAEELGRGAMGVVYRAVDPAIGRSVAIKAINRSYLESLGVRPEEYAERFQREAQVAGALNHPHIVKIFDLGPDYLVMEYVEGQTLAAMLRARGRVPHMTALRILGQAAAAVDHAHASGIVHRDIKPANIMMQPDGSVKVMDFGLARIESSTLTAAGEVLGSAAYMAPEVVLGQPADARSDNFSLAVVAYELLTGLRPFAGPTVSAIIQSVVRTTPRSVRELDATLPPEVDPAFARALAKEPAERYALAGDFARALASAPWRPLTEGDAPLDVSAATEAGQATVILATASTILPPDEPPAAEEATTILTVDAEELGESDQPPAVDAAGERGTDTATVILKASPAAAPPVAPPAAPAADAASATAKLKTPLVAAPPPAPPAAEPDAAEPAATVILKTPAPPAPPAPVVEEAPAATVILKAPPASRAPVAHEPSAGEPAATVTLKAPAPPSPPAAAPLSEPASTVVLPVPAVAPPASESTVALPPPPPPVAAAPVSQPAPPAPTPPTPPLPVAPPAPGAQPAPAPATKPAVLAAEPPAPRRPTSVGWIAGVVVVILLLFSAAAAGFFWLVRSQNTKDATASPAPVAESPAPPAEEAAPPAATAAETAPAAEPTPEAPAAAGSESVPAATAPQPATLVVSSDPAGATVSIGRRRRGRTPLRVSVAPGMAAVVVEKEGFKPWRESARLKPGETRSLQARLEPLAPPRAAPAPPPPPAKPAVREGDLVALGPDVTPPRKLSGDSPNIPDKIRRRLSGSVVVEFVVGVDGRASDAKVVESINLVADKAALDAVATWRFEPARSHGVRVRVMQRAKFTYVSQ